VSRRLVLGVQQVGGLGQVVEQGFEAAGHLHAVGAGGRQALAGVDLREAAVEGAGGQALDLQGAAKHPAGLDEGGRIGALAQGDAGGLAHGEQQHARPLGEAVGEAGIVQRDHSGALGGGAATGAGAACGGGAGTLGGAAPM